MTTSTYTKTAVTLHWLIATGIIGMIILGIYMTRLGPEQASLKFELYQWHKSFGITILLLSLVRLGWRLMHKPPALPAHMASWERLGASISHVTFYVLMLGLPLSGWAMVSASPWGIPTVLFDVIPWPHLPGFEGIEHKEPVEAAFKQMHFVLAVGTTLLLFLHIGAALKHHYKDKDDVLARMLPFLRRT